MGDFTVYNVPNHFTAERLSTHEQEVIGELCDRGGQETPEIQREETVLADARS